MLVEDNFEKYHLFKIKDQSVKPGQTFNTELKISETFTGAETKIPLHIRVGKKPGAVVFVSGAIHGDEVNGPGIIHELILNETLEIERGILILAPVVNLLGFERHSRYLPDRRDLNRYFPGSSNGSLASRIAKIVFSEIITRCDYGIDIHAAAADRTNHPNIRGNLKDPAVRRIAKAFGTELVVNSEGPTGSMRREACKVGCATICFEAGEILKLKNKVRASGVSGILNVLTELNMISSKIKKPTYQAVVNHSFWIRADEGGFIKFTAQLGEPLLKDQEIARICDLMGKECRKIISPCDGIIMGLSTMPLVRPGYPVCHLATTRKDINKIKELTLKKKTSKK